MSADRRAAMDALDARRLELDARERELRAELRRVVEAASEVDARRMTLAHGHDDLTRPPTAPPL